MRSKDAFYCQAEYKVYSYCNPGLFKQRVIDLRFYNQNTSLKVFLPVIQGKKNIPVLSYVREMGEGNQFNPGISMLQQFCTLHLQLPCVLPAQPSWGISVIWDLKAPNRSQRAPNQTSHTSPSSLSSCPAALCQETHSQINPVFHPQRLRGAAMQNAVCTQLLFGQEVHFLLGLK